MHAFVSRQSFSMQMDCFTRRLFCSSVPLVPVSLPSPRCRNNAKFGYKIWAHLWVPFDGPDVVVLLPWIILVAFLDLFSLYIVVNVPTFWRFSRETHFWYIVPDEVKDASLLNQYLELLSPCEKENVFQMRGEKLQKGALLARALVRTTLARYTNSQASPRSLKFRKNRFGKPEVEWPHNEHWNPPCLHFNISHTSSLIACGVTVDMPIGIDVEEKQRKTRNNPLSFARRYFSPHEVEVLNAITDPEFRQREFIRLWTLKEAYVKALGRGFSAAPFKTFTIRIRSNTKSSLQGSQDSRPEDFEVIVEDTDDPSHITTNWKFGLFELASSHYAAICVANDNTMEGEGNPLKLKVWRTLPFVQDEYVNGTDSVVMISGLT